MRPWQHARSSAARTDGDWRDDLPIHEFLDMTKAAHPDLRHRMILHNVDLGLALVQRAFPDRPDATEIARKHIVEDMNGAPIAMDWLKVVDLARLPMPNIRGLDETRAELVGKAAAERNLADTSEPEAVFDLLALPARLCPDLGVRALAMTCNAIGPVIVRQILGPPREVRDERGITTVFDPAWVAEGMIWSMMGRRIPALSSVVGCLRALPS